MLFWKSWIDAAQFCFEAQSVIAMRLMAVRTARRNVREWCWRKSMLARPHTPPGRSRSWKARAWKLLQNSRWRRSSAAFAPIICVYYAAETGLMTGSQRRPEAQ
jgi:hypothetical protein